MPYEPSRGRRDGPPRPPALPEVLQRNGWDGKNAWNARSKG